MLWDEFEIALGCEVGHVGLCIHRQATTFVAPACGNHFGGSAHLSNLALLLLAQSASPLPTYQITSQKGLDVNMRMKGLEQSCIYICIKYKIQVKNTNICWFSSDKRNIQFAGNEIPTVSLHTPRATVIHVWLLGHRQLSIVCRGKGWEKHFKDPT